MAELLEVEDLTVEYRTRRATIRAVNGVSFILSKGSTLGVVGESGSGKSTLGHAIMRLVDPPGVVAGGHIYFGGTDLLALDAEEIFDGGLQRIGGVHHIGDPAWALDGAGGGIVGKNYPEPALSPGSGAREDGEVARGAADIQCPVDDYFAPLGIPSPVRVIAVLLEQFHICLDLGRSKDTKRAPRRLQLYLLRTD
jgi:energy-coupling factor transporter ATP-binding protein EcfA2